MIVQFMFLWPISSLRWRSSKGIMWLSEWWQVYYVKKSFGFLHTFLFYFFLRKRGETSFVVTAYFGFSSTIVKGD